MLYSGWKCAEIVSGWKRGTWAGKKSNLFSPRCPGWKVQINIECIVHGSVLYIGKRELDLCYLSFKCLYHEGAIALEVRLNMPLNSGKCHIVFSQNAERHNKWMSGKKPQWPYLRDMNLKLYKTKCRLLSTHLFILGILAMASGLWLSAFVNCGSHGAQRLFGLSKYLPLAENNIQVCWFGYIAGNQVQRDMKLSLGSPHCQGQAMGMSHQVMFIRPSDCNHQSPLHRGRHN